MNINRKNRRTTRWTIDLRWAAALAFAAATFAACGTDSPEDGAAADAAVEAPEQQPATPAGGVAFVNSDQQRHEPEQPAALIQRAQGSDRHLETLAEQAEVQAREQRTAQGSDRHLENLAEQAEVQAREQQAQGSDQHLENVAEQAEVQAREQQAQGSDQHLENLAG